MPATLGSPQYLKPVPEFTVFAVNTITDQVFAELPVANLKFQSEYKKSQTCTFDLVISDPRYKGKFSFVDATTPFKMSIYIEFMDLMVWGGIIWARGYSTTNDTISVSCREFGSFYERQFMFQDTQYTTTEQFEIARDLINMVGFNEGGSIGLEYGGDLASGVLRDATYYKYDYTSVMQRVDELSNYIDGFDWSFVPIRRSNGTMGKQFVLRYVTFPSLRFNSNLLFEYPGCIVDYDWPEDASGLTTHMVAIGAGEGYDMVVGEAENLDLIRVGGYPRADNSYSYKDVSVESTLDAHAYADLQSKHDFTLGNFYVRAESDCGLGTFTIGDSARFRLKSEFHPADEELILFLHGTSVDGSTGIVTLSAGLVL